MRNYRHWYPQAHGPKQHIGIKNQEENYKLEIRNNNLLIFLIPQFIKYGTGTLLLLISVSDPRRFFSDPGQKQISRPNLKKNVNI